MVNITDDPGDQKQILVTVTETVVIEPPMFPSDTYQFTILENSTNGQAVGSLGISDQGEAYS